MTGSTVRPYREEDIEARLAALLRRRDEVAKELKLVRVELASLRPWSWLRFVLGLALPPIVTVIALDFFDETLTRARPA